MREVYNASNSNDDDDDESEAPSEVESETESQQADAKASHKDTSLYEGGPSRVVDSDLTLSEGVVAGGIISRYVDALASIRFTRIGYSEDQVH
jgi:hypothetical protein